MHFGYISYGQLPGTWVSHCLLILAGTPGILSTVRIVLLIMYPMKAYLIQHIIESARLDKEHARVSANARKVANPNSIVGLTALQCHGFGAVPYGSRKRAGTKSIDCNCDQNTGFFSTKICSNA